VLAEPLLAALPSEQQGDDDENSFEQPIRKSAPNVFQRYKLWAGQRSIIFQSILLGWTAFSLLGTCGWMFSFLLRPAPLTAYEREAEAGALGFVPFCGCGVYLLLAIPLLFAIVATLEFGKKN